MDQVLIILGSFITLILMVIAWFARQTLIKTMQIEIRLVEFATKHDATAKLAERNELEIYKLRERLHSIEGGQAQVLSWLSENKE